MSQLRIIFENFKLTDTLHSNQFFFFFFALELNSKDRGILADVIENKVMCLN